MVIYKTLFFLCLVLSFSLSFASKENIFLLKKTYDNISVHVSSNKTRLTVNYKDTSSKSEKITKEFIQTLEQTKRKMLHLIGVSKWKINKTKVKKLKKGIVRVTLSGSYMNYINQRTYFIEYHFYSPNKKLQLLLTNNKKKWLKKDAELDNIEIFRAKYEM